MAMKEVARLTNVIYWDSDKSSWRKEVKRLEDYKKILEESYRRYS